MALIFRTVEFLSLGLWLGADVFLSFVVAPGAFAMLAGVVLFFAMVIGASAYFPRAERKDV